jgi:hypothetical protein
MQQGYKHSNNSRYVKAKLKEFYYTGCIQSKTAQE